MMTKEQAVAAALRKQLEELLSLFAQATGRLEVVAHVADNLLGDKISAKALETNVDEISDAVQTAGTQTRAALDRVRHIEEALRS